MDGNFPIKQTLFLVSRESQDSMLSKLPLVDMMNNGDGEECYR